MLCINHHTPLLLPALQGFDAASRKHKVVFADSTQADLDLAVVPWQPVSGDAAAAAAAAAGAGAGAQGQGAEQAAAEEQGQGKEEGAGQDQQQQAGRAVKKIKLSVKPSGGQPAAAAVAAEATKTDPLSSPEGGRIIRPRRQATITPAPAAAAAAPAKTASAAAAEKKIKSPGSPERAQRTAAAQIGARIKIMWTKDKQYYSGEIQVRCCVVSVPRSSCFEPHSPTK